MRPDLTFAELRGNIATRLEKIDSFDAIVMAGAALDRLGEEPELVDVMSVEQMVPQVGQGALAIECRVADSVAIAGLAMISHPESLRLFECERSFLRELGGDCSMPAGAHAVLVGDTISLTGFLASEELSHSHQISVTGTNGSALGTNLAIDLRARLG